MILPICNKRPETAPHLGRLCFFLCWRCTGIVFGIILINILVMYLGINSLPLGYSAIGILLPVPCIIDGYKQYYLNIESNNRKRALYGILAGMGIRCFVFAVSGL